MEIEGNVDAQLKNIILEVNEKHGKRGVEDLLEIIDVHNYSFKDDKLFVGKEEKIKNIDIKDNIAFLDSTIIRASGVRRGMELSKVNIEKMKDNIVKYYKENGYVDAAIKKVSYDKGNLIVRIEEGKLYVVDDVFVEIENERGREFTYLEKIKDNGLNLFNIAGINIVPSAFNKKTVDYYRNQLRKSLNKEGYINSKIEYSLKDSSFTHPFVNLNMPFSTVLSIIPFFHKNVIIVYKVELGEKYNFHVNGVPDKLKNEIINIISDNLKGIDIFSIRESELKIQRFLISKLYMQPLVNIDVEKNILSVSITYRGSYDRVEYDIDFKRSDDKQMIGLIKKLGIYATDFNFINNIKSFIISNLKERGYYSPLVALYIDAKDKTLIVKGNVEEGSKYTIRDIYLNGRLYKKNLNITAEKEDIETIKKNLRDRLSKIYYLINLSLGKKSVIDSLNVVDLYFKADYRKAVIEDVYIYKPLIYERVVKRYLNRERFIINRDIQKLRDTIDKQPHIESYHIRPIYYNDNNTADLVVYTEESPKNRFYGSLGYDNVDKISFFLGYVRKNFLGSMNSLEILGGVTSKEKEIGFSLTGFDIFGYNLSNISSFSFRDRDEDDFDYRRSRFNLGFNKIGVNYFLGALVYYEHLDIYETDFTEEIENIFEREYDNYGLSLEYKYYLVDNKYSPKNGAIFDFRLTPVNFFKDDDFYKNEFGLSLYKSIAKILITVKGEIGAIAGSNSDIPAVYRYTLGGPNKMKAYDYREIGSEDRNGVVYGGKYYYYSLFYLAYNLFPMVYLGPFFEIGDAFDDFNDSHGYKDIGLMFELKSKVGSFTTSYAVNPEDNEKSRQAFYISFETTF
ncbi:MAG: BamA/TamA family outer membrane protein [Deferribacterota bacterium]|nr:BamA/TamA family outer membrane protein [Deferribacterota bacterium]